VANKNHLGCDGKMGLPFTQAKKSCLFVHDLPKERGASGAHGGAHPWGPQATQAESARAGALQELAFEWD
jgi:hypothetical protein